MSHRETRSSRKSRPSNLQKDVFALYRGGSVSRIVHVKGESETPMQIDIALKQIVIYDDHPLITALSPKELSCVMYHEENHLFVAPRTPHLTKCDMNEIGNRMSTKESRTWLMIIYNYYVDQYGIRTKAGYEGLMQKTADEIDNNPDLNWWKELTEAVYRTPVCPIAKLARAILSDDIPNAEKAVRLRDLFKKSIDQKKEQQREEKENKEKKDPESSDDKKEEEKEEEDEEEEVEKEEEEEEEGEKEKEDEEEEEGNEEGEGNEEEGDEETQDEEDEKDESDREEDSDGEEDGDRPADSDEEEEVAPPDRFLSIIPGADNDDAVTDELEMKKSGIDDLVDEETRITMAGIESGRLVDIKKADLDLVRLKRVLDVFQSGFSVSGKFKSEETGSGFLIGYKSAECGRDLAMPASARDLLLMGEMPIQHIRTRKLGVSKHGTGLTRLVIYQDVSSSVTGGIHDEYDMSEAYREIAGVTCGLISEIKKNGGEVAHALFSDCVRDSIPYTKDYLSVLKNAVPDRKVIGGGTSFDRVLIHATRELHLKGEDVAIVTDGEAFISPHVAEEWKRSGNRAIIAIAGRVSKYYVEKLVEFCKESGGKLIVYDSESKNCSVVTEIGEVFAKKKV